MSYTIIGNQNSYTLQTLKKYEGTNVCWNAPKIRVFFAAGSFSRVQKSIEKFVFRPKMAIFRRAGLREGGLPLRLAFHYLILMI
jgi:hypothetical protein